MNETFRRGEIVGMKTGEDCWLFTYGRNGYHVSGVPLSKITCECQRLDGQSGFYFSGRECPGNNVTMLREHDLRIVSGINGLDTSKFYLLQLNGEGSKVYASDNFPG